MVTGIVGAGIVNIITESLYDKPIVVFREYIQNAVDSIGKVSHNDGNSDCIAQIWLDGNSLFFLDNGVGIDANQFLRVMISIAKSGKNRVDNIGYKGIGRLSGISYCNELTFVSINNYKERTFSQYVIDCNKYRKIQTSNTYDEWDFNELMSHIGTIINTPDTDSIMQAISKHADMFISRNTGFLVILKEVKMVLQNILSDSQFTTNLGWLLPVPFKQEMLNPGYEDYRHELFSSLMSEDAFDSKPSVPAKSYNIFYNGNQVTRPLTNKMIRKYLCKSNLGSYAICVHSFSNKKIEIDGGNNFTGIRVYIDNVLLCDENELIPALQQYGLIYQGSTFEVIQSVRGIGAMIFITDKLNISANARRTFIDVTDNDSLCFLELVGNFVDSIYKARYALSRYVSAKRKDEINEDKLSVLRENAQTALEVLARSDIIPEIEETEPISFQSMTKTEQQRAIKTTISRELNVQINKYISQVEAYNLETCYDDFKTWLCAN